MFTGLIAEVATLAAAAPCAGGRRLQVRAPAGAARLSVGDSVALDGVCLTVERVDSAAGVFDCTAVHETLRRSTAGSWRPGRRLHLESALAAGAALGGHFVQGHVDGVGRVLRVAREGGEIVLQLSIPTALRKYVVAKGSLAVDGVSLTVGRVTGGTCRLYIIPETARRTRLGAYRAGERVNIEVDLLSKYVESLLAPDAARRRRPAGA